MKELKSLLESKLNSRTTESLKNDVRVSMISEDEGSNLIFVLGLNILEKRLTSDAYELFEDSL